MEREIMVSIVSAGAALTGVMLSQASSVLQSALNRKHEKNKLLRQKYEEVMLHFAASLEWLRDLDSCTTKLEVLSHSQSKEGRKALSLCLLYFPDLVDAANNYVNAQSQYFISVVTAFKDGIPANAGAQALVHNKHHHEKASVQLTEMKNFFENLIVKNSKRYTKA